MKYEKIKTKEEYDEYMMRFSIVFHAKVGTPEGDEAEILAKLIEEYEERIFPTSR